MASTAPFFSPESTIQPIGSKLLSSFCSSPGPAPQRRSLPNLIVAHWCKPWGIWNCTKFQWFLSSLGYLDAITWSSLDPVWNNKSKPWIIIPDLRLLPGSVRIARKCKNSMDSPVRFYRSITPSELSDRPSSSPPVFAILGVSGN